MSWGKRRTRIGCAGVVLVAVVVVAVLAAAYSSLPHHELPDDFDFHGEDITQARRAALPQLEAQLNAVERRSGIEPVGPMGRSDWCEPGQDNFERSDTYAYTCFMELVQVFPVHEHSRAEASRLGEALIAGDCPTGTKTDQALADYPDLATMPGSGGECGAGYEPDAPAITGWFRVTASPDELAEGAYRLPTPCSLREGPGLCEETPLDLGAAARDAPGGTTYLATVSIRRSYHDVPW